MMPRHARKGELRAIEAFRPGWRRGPCGRLVLVGAAPAHAAAPTNDTFGGAVPIGSVPFTTSADTSQATTDADDANANAICGAPATDASVWYSTTPATDGGLVVDVSRSSYTAGVLVV